MNLLAQVETTTSSDGGSAFGVVLAVVYFVIAIVALAGVWKTIDKTDQPGAWALLWLICFPIGTIPFLKATGRPTWWVVLFFIPIVNIIMWLILCMDLAKSFGKGAGYGVGLFFLPFIFFIMLGFGSDQYRGPAVQAV